MKPYTCSLATVHLHRTTQVVASNLVWTKPIDKRAHDRRDVMHILSRCQRELRETATTARIQYNNRRVVLFDPEDGTP